MVSVSLGKIRAIYLIDMLLQVLDFLPGGAVQVMLRCGKPAMRWHSGLRVQSQSGVVISKLKVGNLNFHRAHERARAAHQSEDAQTISRGFMKINPLENVRGVLYAGGKCRSRSWFQPFGLQVASNSSAPGLSRFCCFGGSEAARSDKPRNTVRCPDDLQAGTCPICDGPLNTANSAYSCCSHSYRSVPSTVTR